MFPKLFKEDEVSTLLVSKRIKNPQIAIPPKVFAIPKAGALRPSISATTLPDRAKYSRKSFVVADFSPIEDGYKTNRLYTLVLLSVGIISFLILSYGLRSGLSFLIDI